MMFKNIIICALLALSYASFLKAEDALQCPKQGQLIEYEGLTQEALDFYDKNCFLKPDPNTGLLKPYAMKHIPMRTSSKIAMRAPGINALASPEA